MRVSILALAILLGAAAFAGAAVVSNGGVSFQQAAVVPGSNYAIGVAQSLDGSTIDTSTFFRLTASAIGGPTTYQFQAVDHNVDEASDWYIAPAGADFTESTIAAGAFTPLVVVDTFYPSVRLLNNSTFCLAFDTGLQPNPTRGEVLGWLRVRHADGTLTLLGSGVAYDEPGIVIGTTTVVPEPSSLLAATAFGMLSLRRLRSRHEHDRQHDPHHRRRLGHRARLGRSVRGVG